MWHSFFAYLKFLKRSTNQHGVHSPFVYNLITKCFYNKTSYKDYEKLIDYRNTLLENKNSINITDLGSGSRVTKSNTRKIADIAKNSGTSYKRAKLLYRLSNYFQINNALELGTSLGIATQALSLGHPNTKITTIEGCPSLSKFSEKNFKQFNLTNIEVLTGDFKDAIQKLNSNSYDLIFFDGNHQKEATLNYFETLLQCAHNDSVFIFDDIYWSKGMTEVWKTIIQHPKVTISIDTFFWGFVFFRKEQAKEHFTIRV
jgi:predicted O-methyltransferase YrrM